MIWRLAIPEPVQGIRVKTSVGRLRINDGEHADQVLWRDTAPDECVFELRSKKAAEIIIWNCWRDERGTMQAWIGNCGMVTNEVSPNAARCECNSRPEITFQDVVFDVIFEQPESGHAFGPKSAAPRTRQRGRGRHG